MALRDPVSVYVPTNNAEAQLVCNLLNEEGIEAFAMEDVSQAGAFSLGLLPEIHRPQVWVDRSQVEEANDFLKKYEKTSLAPSGKKSADFCYQCGESVSPSAKRCPACNHELDWGDDSREEKHPARRRTGERPTANRSSSSAFDQLRRLKRPIAVLLLMPLILTGGLVGLAFLGSLFPGTTGGVPPGGKPVQHMPSAERRSVVHFTPAAIAKLRAAGSGVGYVRVSVIETDAPTYTYEMKFDDAANVEADYLDRTGLLSVVVDKRSALFLEGTTIDWRTTPDGQEGFHFDNPNADEQPK
jgi:Fe-S cluster assembly iron-binding protein IscA